MEDDDPPSEVASLHMEGKLFDPLVKNYHQPFFFLILERVGAPHLTTEMHAVLRIKSSLSL